MPTAPFVTWSLHLSQLKHTTLVNITSHLVANMVVLLFLVADAQLAGLKTSGILVFPPPSCLTVGSIRSSGFCHSTLGHMDSGDEPRSSGLHGKRFSHNPILDVQDLKIVFRFIYFP